MLQEPSYTEQIASELNLKVFQTSIVLELTAEWATVPFIARYRKERTWWLDENQIRDIIELKTKIENLYKAKQTAINGITEMRAMTPELMENILKAKTLKEVEEIYKPYKSKKKTKAMLAIEKGFQVVADFIKTNPKPLIPHPNPLLRGEGEISNLNSLSQGEVETPNLSSLSQGEEKILPPDKSLSSTSLGRHRGGFPWKDIPWIESLLEKYSGEEILEWCVHIISAEISASSDLRANLIEHLEKHESITSKIKWKTALEKLNEKDKAQISKFDIYADFDIQIHSLKPYQILALNRGENLGILNVKIEKSEKAYEEISLHYTRILHTRMPFIDVLWEAFSDGYDTLFKSVENEIRGTLSEIGEDDAIETFRKNLGQLLMTKPEYGKKILAVDPGFRAGCKLCVLDTWGNPVFFDKIYLDSKVEAITKLKNILVKYTPDVIVVGNGTGSNESIELLQSITEKEIFIINESWASVYSASKIAGEEFPNLDSLDRGTVSIGRRYIDPLSELVKIPVGSIGVGMYQHDIPEKKLEEKLGYVVEDTVNEVGINVNTASSYVLEYISGIGKVAAKKIYNHRPYKSRADLKKQLSDAVYEQAVGFLRVPESKEILDNTDIHPEQYALAKYIQGGLTIPHLNSIPHPNPLLKGEGEKKGSIKLGGKEEIRKYYQQEKETLQTLYPDVTVETIEFILDSLAKAGVEKRINSSHKKASIGGKSDYKVGDVVEWVIRNVVAFGAFVDIGMKNDGLVHVSQIADRFISDPKEEVEVGQTVKVRITAIDSATGKIQLSIKAV